MNTIFIQRLIINPGIQIATAFQENPLEAKNIEIRAVSDQSKDAGINTYNEGKDPLNWVPNNIFTIGLARIKSKAEEAIITSVTILDAFRVVFKLSSGSLVIWGNNTKEVALVISSSDSERLTATEYSPTSFNLRKIFTK